MGMTLPFDPSTLPKRAATYLVPPFCSPRSKQFGDALGGAHHVGGPHRFIGGNHHEVFDFVLGRGHREIVCAENVIH